MSLTGAGSFGNNDLTSQSTGLPALTRTTTRDNADHPPTSSLPEGSSPSRHEGVSRTRATSTTEVGEGEGDGPHRDEKAVATGAESGEDDDEIELERRTSVVHALARKYTEQSHAAGDAPGPSVFDIASADEDSPLNPNGPKFSAMAWAKTVADMVAGEGHSFRTAGVAYQHLNVFGFGSATDYQKDIFNVWLEVVGLVRGIFGNSKRRIDILRDFDGIVRKGEMLVVLGPPGSGCSTLLKTIAGDYNGISIDDKSYFNYQGASPCTGCYCL
jgi:ATP-binding cassette, subfamily G (WHITE), member 2, PDR